MRTEVWLHEDRVNVVHIRHNSKVDCSESKEPHRKACKWQYSRQAISINKLKTRRDAGLVVVVSSRHWQDPPEIPQPQCLLPCAAGAPLPKMGNGRRGMSVIHQTGREVGC